jgi:hypothetical protein
MFTFFIHTIHKAFYGRNSLQAAIAQGLTKSIKYVLCFALRFAVPALIGALLAGFPSSLLAEGVARDTWVPRMGDHIVVDTSASIVYLVHDDGERLALDGLTGQHRRVCYDGICYFAETPERDWEIRADALSMKGRSTTFGEGRFLRLSWPGHKDFRRGGIGDGESTSYGFHSHLSFEKMIADKREKTGWDREGTGWRSMGCILLSEDDLTLVEETWRANAGVVRVTTKRVITQEDFAPTVTVASLPSWLGWGK